MTGHMVSFFIFFKNAIIYLYTSIKRIIFYIFRVSQRLSADPLRHEASEAGRLPR